MTVTQGHIFKVKVTVHTYQKSVSRPELHFAMVDLENTIHNGCSRPKGVS